MMNTNILNSYITMRRAGDVVKQGNQILFNQEISDQEKLRQLLNLEFLRVGVGGVQGNYKLISFLCEKENLEQLIKYSIGVPESPENTNEAYKYPNVSQELLCSSAMLAQAIVEGGFLKQKEGTEEDGEKQYDEDDDDERDDDEDSEEGEDDDDDEKDDSSSPKEDGVDTDEDEDEENSGETKEKKDLPTENNTRSRNHAQNTSTAKKLVAPKQLKISINDNDDSDEDEDRDDLDDDDDPKDENKKTEEEDDEVKIDDDKENKNDKDDKDDKEEEEKEDDDDLNEREEISSEPTSNDKKKDGEGEEDADLSEVVKKELEKHIEEENDVSADKKEKKDKPNELSNNQEAPSGEDTKEQPESEAQPKGKKKKTKFRAKKVKGKKKITKNGASPQDAEQEDDEEPEQLDEPDREDIDDGDDEKDNEDQEQTKDEEKDEEKEKEKEVDSKEKDDEEKEDDGEKIEVSDVFLNMNLAGKNKKINKDQTMKAGKKDDDKDDDDDEADFERDDDQGEVDNAEDVENVKDDEDDASKGHTIVRRKNHVNVSVKIYTKKGKNKKKKKGKKGKKKEEPVEEKNPNHLLDILFSFIGVSSVETSSQLLESQYRLGLFEEQCLTSRQTAGTTISGPGQTQQIQAFNETMSSRSSVRDFSESPLKKTLDLGGDVEVVQPLPDLLPVSCGYFKQILLKILLKQRKQVIKYLLIDTQGRTFDQLLKYVRYHSLADLLMELMQLSIVYQQSSGPRMGMGQPEDESIAETQGSSLADDEEGKEGKPNMTVEQAIMFKTLQQKKDMVVNGLINVLSYKNRENTEDSLNATAILIELVELEKTFEVFMANDAEKVGTIMELAVDCANGFNQQYLLQILMAITKQLKQTNDSQNVFRDLDEDGQETNEAKKNQQFDPSLQQNRNTLKFLDQAEKHNLLNCLLLNINSQDLDSDNTMYNQNQQQIKRIGQMRVKSLELMQSVLQLLYPSNGKLARSMVEFMQGAKKQSDSSSGSEDGDDKAKKGEDDFDSPNHSMALARFLPSVLRRHLVKTLLYVLKVYSHCSNASQLCIQILGQIMTMYDVVDVSQLQRFVISEFKRRHQNNKNLDERAKQKSEEEGTEYTPVSRHKLDHTNFQSAQVNQMTSQLKERVELVRKYYGLKTRDEIKLATGMDVMYDDLVNEEERKFWTTLCKKDFKRLEKYQILNMGEGHFLDESEEEDSEEREQQKKKEEEREQVPLEGLLFHKDRDDKNGEDFDHDKFMEDMIKNIQDQQNLDDADEKTRQIQEQIRRMEEQRMKEKDQEEAKYVDNNFWRLTSQKQEEADVDALLAELESPEKPKEEDEDNNEGQEDKEDQDDEEEDDDKEEDYVEAEVRVVEKDELNEDDDDDEPSESKDASKEDEDDQADNQ